MPLRRNRLEKGNALMEFGLVMVFLIPMLFGTVAFGINLGNWLQTTQITRDVGHLYAKGIDFSIAQNQNLAVQLVQGMGGMTVSGGNGVVILSQIRRVYQADCDAAGLSGNCNNLDKRVFSQRVVIGKSALRASNFGTPPPGLVNSSGDIGTSDYLTKASLVATNFDDVMTLEDGDVAYVVEGYFDTPNLSFLGSAGSGGTGGSYSRAIF